MGILYKKYEHNNSFLSEINKNHSKVVLSHDELSHYNGIDHDRLYLAVLGHVFDVTIGNKHYKKGSAYNYFIGKDGSRALVTGDFKDESPLKDHILDLRCNDLLTLLHWRQTYKKKYTFVGFLNGRYYDDQGKETNYMKEVKNRIKQCKVEKIKAEKENLKYPPCNIAWNVDSGSQVWCTKSSGGIKRDWIGVPRQLYTPGEEKPRCVCINLDEDQSSTSLIKIYDNCPHKSTICTVNN
ncbi:unnamed protein product [Parnassius apollo]|uniref:(apollo) hypothetical protein n=1 Tax=Parnassius apollo TaxID=110799 RepID=A0A8S3WYN1_PARAO|nr:unnamed protein product [Parnassius apollo]